MKKIIIVFISLISLYSTAQTLYTDAKGVKILYTIEQTKAYTFCTGKSTAKNFSNKKINIWKVTLEIENGHSTSIVPRGVGIANISVYPDPVQPYSQDYCTYSQVENYASSENRLDQSLFSWSIRDRKVKEIKSEESITNVTYLYLYDGQTPKLSNWQFLGYRLKNDFKSYDPILVAIKDTVQGTKTVIQEVKKVRKVKESSSISQKSVHLETNDSAAVQKNNIQLSKVAIKPKSDSSQMGNVPRTSSSEPVTIKKTEPSAIVTIKPDVSQISDTIKTIIPKPVRVEKTEPSVIVKVKSDVSQVPMSTKTVPANSVTVRKIQPCPGEKALAYKEKSNLAADIPTQKAYSWLALYYTYRCECEKGSPRSDQLVAIINNVVDSYTENTDGSFEKIVKVTKCTSPIANR